jgi:hypothetical protein
MSDFMENHTGERLQVSSLHETPEEQRLKTEIPKGRIVCFAIHGSNEPLAKQGPHRQTLGRYMGRIPNKERNIGPEVIRDKILSKLHEDITIGTLGLKLLSRKEIHFIPSSEGLI